MCERDEQIGGYRLRQTEGSVAIDERTGFMFGAYRAVFGLAFTFPLIFCTVTYSKSGFVVDPDSFADHHPIWSWLIITPFLCIPFVFAFLGVSIAFSRECIEATNYKIFTGIKWFNLWPRLKAIPISEIASINLYWTRRGPFSGRRVCGVSMILTESNKLKNLVCCAEHGDALKLAKAISDKTNLPIQDITDPICLTTR